MNPSSGESLNLPPPVTEQAPQPVPGHEANTPAPETGSRGAEKAAGTAQPTAAMPVAPSLPLPPVLPAAGQPTAANTTTKAAVPITADDTDLIEKEWVTKAKQIVERTRDDPHKQSEELTVFKADYLQKRYNKTIKVNK
jgi:hypothetical protein